MDNLSKLRQAMAEIDLPALLITSHYNLRYVSNFTGTTGVALVMPTQAFFVTDSRYIAQASQQANNFKIIENTGPIFEQVNELIQQVGFELIGFEADYVTFAEYDQLSELFEADLVPINGLVENIRAVKTSAEINQIKRACEIADAAYEHILGWIKPGQTEIEVANEIDFFMRKQGATSVSFETIVASGVRSAMPHGVASEKKIGHNELVTIDFGCYYHGYVSDITRTFAIGNPGTELKKIYQIVLEAQLAVIEQVRAGITGKEVDLAARDIITAAGYGANFGHGTFHGIGLEIHEEPMGIKNQMGFAAGTVITDEPGIYLPNLGGVRIEDDLVITARGSENLVHAPKNELIML